MPSASPLINVNQLLPILRAMSMQIAVELLNGQTFFVEVVPETTMSELKQEIKQMRTWEDQVSRDTTVVEVILGDQKVENEDTVAELGLSSDSKLSAVFRQNVARCAFQLGQFEAGIDPELPFVAEIPDSETEILGGAFEHCKRMVKVIIPSSVTTIGMCAFQGCSALIEVSLPDSVTHIEDRAFQHCSSMAHVSIPESLIHLGHGAFRGCSSLKTVRFPQSMTQIAAAAFSGCRALTDVAIPDSVTSIGERAFLGCKSLATVTISNSVSHIGDGAFQGCALLTSVNIPKSVSRLNKRVFKDCSSLASLILPDSLTHIDFDVFTDSPQLTLTAPARLRNLALHAGCKRVKVKECGCGHCHYSWFVDGWLCPHRSSA